MPERHPQAYDGIVLTTPVSLAPARFSEQSAIWFIGRTLARLVEDSGLSKNAIDGLAVSSFTLAPDTVVSLTQHFEMSPRYLEQLPFGGASGILAMRRAARAVQCGDADIVACIGGDTNRREGFSELAANFSRFSIDASWPYGAAGPNAPFALITAAYMARYGARREDFAQIALSQRYNAQHYAHALLGQKSLSLDEYLSARPIAGPLHLYDCVMPCAGGEGFLVMHETRARELGLRFVRILAADERHNAFRDDPVQLRGGWLSYAESLYARAQLTPADIDLVQTYDDYPVISLLQLEGMGFCPEGHGAAWLQNTDLRFDGGGLPHNTSGGQLSIGQAGSAAGFLGLVEAIRQLTGAAIANVVPHARTAAVTGYGMIHYDRGLCSAACLLAGEKL